MSAPAAAARVAYLAHCLLNANSKVDEGARCAGAFAPLVALLRSHGWAIRQLPCPELAFGGLQPLLGGARAVRHAGVPRPLRDARDARRWR